LKNIYNSDQVLELYHAHKIPMQIPCGKLIDFEIEIGMIEMP